MNYANILHGIDFQDGEKNHYYMTSARVEGILELDVLRKFEQSPSLHGGLLSIAAKDIISFYRSVREKSEHLQLYNLNVEILKEFRTWELVAGNFDPIVEIKGNIVTRVVGVDPTNLSRDQADMLVRVCDDYLRRRID